MSTNRKSGLEEKVFKLVAYIYFFLFSLAVLVPFYVVLKNSITSHEESLSTMHFLWFPKQGVTLEAYTTAFFSNVLKAYDISILRAFFNTLWQTLPSLIIGLFVSGLAAFAYAKLKFRGKDRLFTLMVATMMIPGAVLTMPSYVFYDSIGWTNSVLPLMIPGLFGGAGTIFFLRQFFRGIPDELIEAAKIDGMGYMRIYTSVMIPLAKPAFVAQFIFGFVGGYNSYMGPLLYLNGQTRLYPLQQALTLFRQIYSGNGPVVSALTVLALLPLLIVYFCMLGYFTEGIASTGIKE